MQISTRRPSNRQVKSLQDWATKENVLSQVKGKRDQAALAATAPVAVTSQAPGVSETDVCASLGSRRDGGAWGDCRVDYPAKSFATNSM